MRAGADVPQVYVGFPTSTGEPPLQLKGYEKVLLSPGQSQTVSFNLQRSAFSWWNVSRWTVTPGTYAIKVGSSSCNIWLSGRVNI